MEIERIIVAKIVQNKQTYKRLVYERKNVSRGYILKTSSLSIYFFSTSGFGMGINTSGFGVGISLIAPFPDHCSLVLFRAYAY